MSPRTQAIIEVVAEDKASGVLKNIAQGLKNVGQIAGGIVVARGIQAGISGLVQTGKSVLGLASSYQLAQRGLENLLAVQHQVNTAQWQQVKVGTAVTHLSDAEKKELDKLRSSYEKHTADLQVLNARLQEQAQRVWEMKNKWTDQGLAYKTAIAVQEQMQVKKQQLIKTINDEKAAIEALESKEGKLVPIYRRIMKPQESYQEALANTAPKAREVWENIRKLAVSRGISYKVLSSAYQYGLAVGISTDNLDELVSGLADWTVATNRSITEQKYLVKALGDVQSRGHLAGQEIRQFANVNIPLLDLLAKSMGITQGAVMDLTAKGAIPASKVFQVLSDYFQRFGLAAEDMADTLPVATSGLGQFTKIGVAEFFQSAVSAIGDFLAKIRDKALASMPGIFDRAREAGEKFGNWIGGVLSTLQDLIVLFLNGYKAGGLFGGVFAALSSVIPSDVLEQLIVLFGNLKGTFSDIANFITGSVTPAFSSLGSSLPSLASVLAFVNDHWAAFDAAIKTVAATLAAVALASVIAGIAGSIASFATGLGGLIVLVGLAGAAWATYGDQISAFLSGAWNSLVTVFQNFSSWLQDTFGPVINTLISVWQTFFGTSIQAGISAFQTLQPLLQSIWGLFQSLGDLFNTITTIGLLLADVVVKLAEAWGTWAIEKLVGWVQKLADGISSTAQKSEKLQTVIEKVNDAWEFFKELVNDAATALNSVKGFIDGLVEKLRALEDKLKHINLGPLMPGSPSPFEISVRGAEAALKDLNSIVKVITPKVQPVVSSGPNYSVVVNISDSSPESVRDLAYQGVMEAFSELAIQLSV